MFRRLVFLCLLLGAMSTASVASAQQQSGTQLDEAARLTFEEARGAFVAGEYERALGLFRQAYSLSARPGLLYNIAQTLDRLRRDAEALQTFREFLAAQPDTPNRGEVEARIRVLEQAVASGESAGGGGGGEVVGGGGGTTDTGGGGIAILHPAIFLAGAGLTIASAAVLIWSGLETTAKNDAYLAATTFEQAEPLYNAASDQQLLTNVFVGVTSGLAALTVVFAVLSDWNQLTGGGGRASLTPTFFAGPDGAFAGLDASF
jgi:tetratricopeptide (TPR) repeat protein